MVVAKAQDKAVAMLAMLGQAAMVGVAVAVVMAHRSRQL
jgi:hypothetical protein